MSERTGTVVTHRRYVEGPLASIWAPMLGRRRMREAVEGFVRRERKLALPER